MSALPIILADLDDTLFTTMKSYTDHPQADLQQMTVAKNGNHSFVCARRRALLAWIEMGAILIPVTARSIDAFKRVDASLSHAGHGAVVSSGAVILQPGGAEDQTWADKTSAICDAAQPAMQAAQRALTAQIAPDGDAPPTYRLLVHTRGDDVIGMTAKSNSYDGDDVGAAIHLETLERAVRMAAPDLTCHINGNNLAITPSGISKRAAVEYLLATRVDLQNRPLIGAGDSPSDLPFMDLCDMMIVPRGTRNADLLMGKTSK
jgi:hydroxymethylpyrimidine pyrophosphatase-like HAD family hydrolase